MAVLTFWHNRIGGFEKKVAVNVLLVMQPSEKKESETETLRQLDTVKKDVVKTVIMIITCPATRLVGSTSRHVGCVCVCVLVSLVFPHPHSH